MTQVFRGGTDITCNHPATYMASPAAGYSIVSSPAPPQGTYWLRAVNPTTSFISSMGSTSSQTHQFISRRGFRADGTFNAASRFGIWWPYDDQITHSLGLRGIGQSNGKYRVALADTETISPNADIVGTTEYSSTDVLAIRHHYTGSTLTVNINGVDELSVAYTGTPKYAAESFPYFDSSAYGGADMATVTKYWSASIFMGGDSGADRIGTDIWVGRCDPNGDSTSEWGNQADCNSSTLGTYTNVDDYAVGGTPDNATTMNCTNVGGRAELSTLTSVTPTGTIRGVQGIMWYAASLNDKLVTGWFRLRYSGVDVNIAISWGNTTWKGGRVPFPDPPGGGAWSQTIIDGLILGHVAGSTINATLQTSALALAVYAVNDDPIKSLICQPRPLAGLIGR